MPSACGLSTTILQLLHVPTEASVEPSLPTDLSLTLNCLPAFTRNRASPIWTAFSEPNLSGRVCRTFAL